MNKVEFSEEVVNVYYFIMDLIMEGDASSLAKIKQEYVVVSLLYALNKKQYEPALLLARILENPNIKTLYGIPLAEAIKHQQINIIDALLEKGAFADINDLDGTPLLTQSVKTENFAVFGKILMKEPNLFAEDKDGVSCLKHIIKISEKHNEINEVFQIHVDGLVQKKFIKAVDDCDLNSLKEIFPKHLNFISQVNIFNALKFFIVSKYDKDKSFALIHFLFPYLDNPDFIDKDGFTIVHYACIKNKPDIIKLLSMIGASLLIKDKNGLLPHEILFKLGYSGSSKIISKLVEEEIDKS